MTVPPNSTFQSYADGPIAVWLDDCESQLLHPADVADRARRQGWPAAQAAQISQDYRRRFNEHTLGYSTLLITTGVVALAAGTVAHLGIGGLNGRVNRNDLAVWLTILITVLPFAVWSHLWAARVDREDPVAVWSRPRQSLAATLLWACGVVGALRLMVYMTQLMGALVGASWARHLSLAVGAMQVATSLSISLPLGAWAYDFLHRFDVEDPTAPPAQRRRRRA